MAEIAFDRVGLRLSGRHVLRDISLVVPDRSLVAIIGPSGSGKTSLLRLASGLLEPTFGTVTIGGRSVDARAPWRNRVAMVFQDDALYEHLSVSGNLEFPWRIQGHDRAYAIRQAISTAARTGVRRLLARQPRTLSGGERGQVATARALSRSDPSVILLDEPLAHADATMRRRFRSEIERLHRESRLTMLLATNDQHEAMAVATHLAVLVDGEILQFGTPREIYHSPRNAVVAAFVGNPAMNLFPANASAGDPTVLEIGSDRVRYDRIGPGVTGRVLAGVYPHELRLADAGDAFEQTIHVVIGRIEHTGSAAMAYFGLGRHQGIGFSITLPPDSQLDVGDRIELKLAEASLRLFDAASGDAIPM